MEAKVLTAHASHPHNQLTEQGMIKSSKDCLTTKQKAAFMLEACKPDLLIRRISDSRDSFCTERVLDPENHSWDFRQWVYEIHPAPESDKRKIEAIAYAIKHGLGYGKIISIVQEQEK